MPKRPENPQAAVSDALSGGLGGVTSLVSVTFGSHAPKAGKVAWKVRSLTLTETIGTPFTATLELGTDDTRVLASEMRGKHAWVKLERGQKRRFFHGLVTTVTEGMPGVAARVVHVELRPAVELLRLVTRSRIFADMTVPEVVKTVLGDGLVPFKRTVKLDLDTTIHDKREYIVQHQETDLAFALRLMAEEGLWMIFVDPDDADKPEEVVVTNANAKAPSMSKKSPSVALALDRKPDAHEEAIFAFDVQEGTAATSFSARQVNWTHPEVREYALHKAVDTSGLELPRDAYGELHAAEYTEATHTKFDTKRRAQLDLESERSQQRLFLGRSNAVLLRAGHSMEVDGQTYLLTYVRHAADARLNLDEAGHTAAYDNNFEAIHKDVPHRPAMREPPRVAGYELATVVDAAGGVTAPRSASEGGDIAVDSQKHGRIRVKFHWDETAAGKGGSTSCWLRAMQSWAGRGWGAQFTPRVGMEVVVGFEGGHPDRPMVLGCVHNGLNDPPYADKPTQSGIRTQSSVKPGDYNELRFDDAAGAEQVYVRAQRNYDEEVLNDHTTTVTGKQTQTVKKSQNETVNGNATLSVGGKRTKTVGGDKENGEDINIKGEQKTTVSKKYTGVFQDEHEVTVTKAVKENYLATHDRTVTETQKLEAKADKIEHVVGSYELTTDKAYVLNQGGTKVTFEGNKVALDAAGPISVKRGPATIDIDGGGNMAFKTTGAITFEVGPNKVVISMSGIELESPTGVSAKVAPSELALTPASASLKSVNTTVEATALCAIKGTAMVGLN